MPSGHPPMVTVGGSFFTFGERATDHYSVCTSSERLTHVTTSSNSAVGDYRYVLPCFLEKIVSCSCSFNSGADLWNANSQNFSTCAYRSGANTDHDALNPLLHELFCDLIRNCIANKYWNIDVFDQVRKN